MRSGLIITLILAALAFGVHAQRNHRERLEAAAAEAEQSEARLLALQLAELEPKLAAAERECEQLVAALAATNAALTEAEAAGDPLRRTVERLSAERIQQGVTLEQQRSRIDQLEHALATAQHTSTEQAAALEGLRRDLTARDASLADVQRRLTEREQRAAADAQAAAGALAAAKSEASGARQRVQELEQAQAQQAAELKRRDDADRTLNEELRMQRERADALRRELNGLTNLLGQASVRPPGGG